MNTDIVSLPLAAAALAVGFHLAIIPYEIDFQIKRLFGLYLAAVGSLFYLLYRQKQHRGESEGESEGGGLSSAAATTAWAATVFNTSLALSIFVHRVFLHRTGKFPGPFWAKVSRFYAVHLTFGKLQYYKEIERLHHQYGDFVRTGPREISIARPAALQAIYGTSSACTKSCFYGQATDDPDTSLTSTRVKVVFSNHHIVMHVIRKRKKIKKNNEQK